MAETHSVDHLLEHAGWVRRLARSLVGDASQADDLCQETWMRALEHPPAADRPVRGWLAAVMRNALRQRRRGDGRRRAHEGALVPAADVEPVDEVVGRAALHKDLVDELLQLDEPFRATLLLRYFEGLSPAAIAARDRASLATVKSRLARGLEKLRERLDRRAHGERGRWMAALAPLASPLGWTPSAGLPHVASPAASAAGSLPVASAAGWTASIGAFLNLKLIAVVLATAAAAVAALTLVPNEPEAAAPRPAGLAHAAAELVRPDVEPPHATPGTAPATATALRVREALAPPAAAEALAAVAPAPAELHTVRGRVIDIASNPLPGVDVVLESNASGSAPEAAEAWARARSELGGRFELESERRGGRVVVRDERWVTVLAGGFASEDVVVVAAPRIALAGRVIDAAGRGVAGARVALVPPETMRASLETVLDFSADVFFATSSDADGGFELADVPALAGALLEVARDGYAQHAEPAPQQTLRDIVLVLEAPPSGPRVLRGRVVDTAQAPVEGAQVALGIDMQVTGADGGFAFDLDDERSVNRQWNELAARHMGPDAVLPEPDEVVALAPGRLPARARAHGRTQEGAPIWPDLVVLTLDGETFAIDGVVLGRDGEPLAAARVWIADPTVFGGLGRPDSGGPTFVHAETLLSGGERTWNAVSADDEGRFRIEGLLEREYLVVAMDERTLQRVALPVAAGASGVELVLPVDGLYETLKGRVLSLAGEPLAGVSVHGMCDAFRLQLGGATVGTWHAGTDAVLTDEEGRFELADVPKDLVYLRLDSDRTLSLEWGRHVEGGLAQLVGDDHDALEIRLSVRCHFQVELDDPARADHVAVLDGDDTELEISEFRGPGSRMEALRAPLVEGRSATLAVGEDARTLVLYRRDASGVEREVERVPIALSPHEKRTIRP